MLKAFARVIKNNGARARFIRTLTRDPVILDLGCGAGENGLLLQSLCPGGSIFGIDLISPPHLPSIYHYQKVDLDNEDLPFPDSHFDGIFFTHVIEHLQAPFRLGNELRRVMKPGAKIYIETPNWTTTFFPSIGFHRDQHNPLNFFDDPTHIKPWTKQGIYEFLSQGCRLQVKRVGTVRNWIRLPFDVPVILIGVLTGNRTHIIKSSWNLLGWCIYGIGERD